MVKDKVPDNIYLFKVNYTNTVEKDVKYVQS